MPHIFSCPRWTWTPSRAATRRRQWLALAASWAGTSSNLCCAKPRTWRVLHMDFDFQIREQLSGSVPRFSVVFTSLPLQETRDRFILNQYKPCTNGDLRHWVNSKVLLFIWSWMTVVIHWQDCAFSSSRLWASPSNTLVELDLSGQKWVAVKTQSNYEFELDTFVLDYCLFIVSYCPHSHPFVGSLTNFLKR